MSIRVNGVRYHKPPAHNSQDRVITRHQSTRDLDTRSRVPSRTSQDSSSVISTRGVSPLVPDVSFIKHTKRASLVPNISHETIKHQYEPENYTGSSAKFRPSPKFKDSFEKEFENHDQRVKQFMCNIGCEEFLELFQANQIQYEDLEYLAKDDLIDMGLPVGPRNRILRALQALDKESPPPDPQPVKSLTPILPSKTTHSVQNSVIKTPPRSKIQDSKSPTQYNCLRYEVDNFMKELSVLKTNRRKEASPPICPPSPYSPPEVLKSDKEGIYKLNILFKDITEKQNLLMRAIQQNSYAISVITHRNTSRKSSPMRVKDVRKGRSPFVSPTKAYC